MPKAITICLIKVGIIYIGFQAPLFSEEAVADDEEILHSSDIQESLDKQILVDRIHVVQKKQFSKIKKLEVGGLFGFVPDDPYWFNTQFGANLTFHLSDYFGIEFLNFRLNNFSQRRIQKDLTEKEIHITYNNTKYLLNGGLVFTPIYAKSNLLKTLIVYFDLFLSAGAGLVKTEKDNPLFFYIGPGIRFYVHKRVLLHFDFQSMFYNGITTVSELGEASKGSINILNISGGLSFLLF